jgi:hypothetical protein
MFAFHAEVRVMVLEVAKDPLAIAGVLHGVEDVVVPEGVDVFQGRYRHAREHFEQIQEAAVFDFHGVRALRRPALAGLHMA